MGFEPMIRVLQTLALAAWPRRRVKFLKRRAGNETRTRDLLLGKEVFYQLNYARRDKAVILLLSVSILTEFCSFVKILAAKIYEKIKRAADAATLWFSCLPGEFAADHEVRTLCSSVRARISSRSSKAGRDTFLLLVSGRPLRDFARAMASRSFSSMTVGSASGCFSS